VAVGIETGRSGAVEYLIGCQVKLSPTSAGLPPKDAGRLAVTCSSGWDSYPNRGATTHARVQTAAHVFGLSLHGAGKRESTGRAARCTWTRKSVRSIRRTHRRKSLHPSARRPQAPKGLPSNDRRVTDYAVPWCRSRFHADLCNMAGHQGNPRLSPCMGLAMETQAMTQKG
jgi:hypothetical protein